MSPASTLKPKIDTSRFYSEWSGHPIANLHTFRDTVRALRPGKPIIYLAGDSSLDNKAWISSSPPVPAPEIYAQTLATTSKPAPKPDVAFWMNHLLKDRATCINAAIEATLLRERDSQLLPHDEFIRDSIAANDILVVSVGANDIALSPNKSTMLHLADLSWATRKSVIEDGSASSLRYFRTMFKDNVQTYIERLVAKQKPRAVIVCMIYYPLEADAGQSSWAETQLKMLGYNSTPGKLQAAIKQIYESATKQIKIEGTQVLPCPLFEVLDGKRAEEYTARVEPNSEGGRLMAAKFVEMLNGAEIVDGVRG